jgi:hypothetical protein
MKRVRIVGIAGKNFAVNIRSSINLPLAMKEERCSEVCRVTLGDHAKRSK